MKKSIYNHFFETKEGQVLAYNALTNALATMEKEKYDLFMEMDNVDYLEEDFLKKLIKGGFVVDEQLNELDVVEYRFLQAQFSKESLILTIVPTYDCNFQCVYCFEKGISKKTYMNEEIEKQLIEWINAQKKTIKQLYVTWYGGEPLLAIDIIKRLSDEMINICENNNIKYYASMITNGYLLSNACCIKICGQTR